LTFGESNVSVALPDTVLEEHDSLREKTVKLGQIARACSIYGVDSILIFRDPHGGRSEAPLMQKILQYLETPQYLRKRLYQLDESLRFAGLLPPLRIPSHKPRIPVRKLRTGELREGFVLPDGRSVDIGLEENLRLTVPSPPSKRVTVRILRSEPLEGTIVSRSLSDEYWGYTIRLEADLNKILVDPRYQLKIATSRRGVPPREAIDLLGRRMGDAKSLLLLFGSPSRGLFEMIGPDLSKKVDLVVNLFSEQHVATVRTEEALAAALALLSVMTVLGGLKFKG
jgi:predicted SPOUT superfamily RNA methylase MTH1